MSGAVSCPAIHGEHELRRRERAALRDKGRLCSAGTRITPAKMG
jgi:hypothetical protein